MSTLFVNAHVYSPSAPYSTAVLVQDGRVSWFGDSSGAEVHRELVSTVIDCQGQFLAPAFVDAHVHATSTGVLLEGLDLSMVRDSTELLDLLSRYARLRKGDTVIGHGWDESNWSDPALPTRAEIDRASWGSVVYLSRIDVHSALISSALAAAVPNLVTLNGYSENVVKQDAHGAVRLHVLGNMSSGLRHRAQEAFATHALSRGIGSVHEMAGPTISSRSDAKSLLRMSRHGFGPTVYLYWGQLAQDGGVEVAHELQAHGLGGDLFVDGAIGSRTANMTQDYVDDLGNSGCGYLDSEAISQHLVLSAASEFHTGFHVIGDQAMLDVMSGIQKAAQMIGIDRIRHRRHRLEHAELIDADNLALMKEFNLTASMQPLFDAFWGGRGGMYHQRLGQRALAMNQWTSISASGCLVCFSSDSPVTPMSPWQGIKAAMYHSNENERMTARAAFSASTRAGWRALGPQYDGLGVITEGAPADLVLWEVGDYAVQVPDTRITQWSTDPRSATVALPALEESASDEPRCLMTMIAGEVRYQDSEFDGIKA